MSIVFMSKLFSDSTTLAVMIVLMVYDSSRTFIQPRMHGSMLQQPEHELVLSICLHE